jgi:hypothetical protein
VSTVKRPQNAGRLDREWHYWRRHLVTPGKVITPQSASVDGRQVPGRAQQAGGHGGIRDGALRRLRRRDAIAEGANRIRPAETAMGISALCGDAVIRTL